jgi:hypothetical protein
LTGKAGAKTPLSSFFFFFEVVLMRGWVKALIAFAVVAVLVVVSLGYVGIIGVPLVSPNIQGYPSATEVQYSDVSYLIPVSSKYPSLDEFVESGLDVHIYGTDDRGSVVRGYYDDMTAGWEEMVSESGSGWSWGIWRSNLYGFGLAVYDAPQVKSYTGYNTVFVTVDGPASAWAPLFQQMEQT